MTFSARSEHDEATLPDLELDLPTTPADVAALRRARERHAAERFPDLSALPGAHESLARRPTAAGRPPLAL
jgi:hypothetical protein